MRKLGNWSLEKESVQMYLTDLARGYEEGNTGETDNKDTKKNKWRGATSLWTPYGLDVFFVALFTI